MMLDLLTRLDLCSIELSSSLLAKFLYLEQLLQRCPSEQGRTLIPTDSIRLQIIFGEPIAGEP